MEKKTVAERKKQMGYGIGIRQCHDCVTCEIRSIKEPYSFSYFCLKGNFVVKKTGTCEKWR